MEAHTRTPRELFEGKEHYEIPSFQRPYVWTEEDQWAPLWNDVTRVAEAFVTTRLADPDSESSAHHFLGAVVYESRPPIAGDVTRHDVIDGQQRMTTLQLLMDAAQEVIAGRGHDDHAESLEELILNGSPRFKGRRERFKLWPSQADRTAFERAMDPDGSPPEAHGVARAHRFFKQESTRWIEGAANDDGVAPPGTEELRVEALSSTLQDRLLLVAIDLTGHDDAQLIFETLNDRGTPLLKADLIKNWVFRKGESLKADVAAWADQRWAELDTAWWREEIRQGRLNRARIDIFLQYWLTMRLRDEVKAENTFRVFVDHAEPLMGSDVAAEQLVTELRRDADTYRAFAELDVTTPQGRFYRRVIERLELAVTTPVFLWMLSDNHEVDEAQVTEGLQALESWAIRRTLLGLTTKDVNRFVVNLLKVMDESDEASVGDALFAYLSEQTAETRIWPSDARMAKDLTGRWLYSNVRQDRLRVVLGAVEQHLRLSSTKYEAVQLPDKLEIEHVMPRGWRTYWDDNPKLSADEAAERDRLVNSIGNLTLVTGHLNGSLSNRPWTDSQAVGLKDGGFMGKGKWTLLNDFSLLVLNKEILTGHENAWTDVDIETRGEHLVRAICQVWPGPSQELQTAAQQAATAPAAGELPNVPWTEDEIQRLAREAGETIRVVLDTLAAEPGREWRNKDFADAEITKWAFAAIGALVMKARGSFGRSNVPVIFRDDHGTWWWSVTDAFADTWRRARSI